MLPENVLRPWARCHPPTSPAGNLKPSLRPGLAHAPGWQGPFGEVLPMGRGGRGVTRASVSGLPTQQVSREPTQFSSLKGKERNPPGWIRVHTLDGAGGWLVAEGQNDHFPPIPAMDAGRSSED